MESNMGKENSGKFDGIIPNCVCGANRFQQGPVCRVRGGDGEIRLRDTRVKAHMWFLQKTNSRKKFKDSWDVIECGPCMKWRIVGRTRNWFMLLHSLSLFRLLPYLHSPNVCWCFLFWFAFRRFQRCRGLQLGLCF